MALASKNCFQNYMELTKLFMAVYAGGADLGTFPDISGMLGILLYQRQYTRSYYPMSLAEIVVDLCMDI